MARIWMGEAVMDWEQYRLDVEKRELDSRKNVDGYGTISYIGKFSDDDYVLSTGNSITHGELWEFTTKYKYMSKLSNVLNYDSKCLTGYNASKMDRCLELGCDWGHCFDVFENFFRVHCGDRY
jgi:hypothetical protein